MTGEQDNLKASRFYVKNNKVIDHVADIEKKEDMNQYTIELTKQKSGNEKQAQGFTGKVVKRVEER